LSFERAPANSLSDAVNIGFSRQSNDYDHADKNNLILQDMRRQVYTHVAKNLKPESHILEINAGTGIDALHFIADGHRVHATDLSDGMISQIRAKSRSLVDSSRLTIQQLSFERLDQLSAGNFEYVFSNFGGLNCIQDLSLVTRHLPSLLKPGAYVTVVIMPPVCIWELLWVFKGSWGKAFRRLSEGGTTAHLSGAYFQTYYHSLKRIRRAFGSSFDFITSEGLAALSPPPHATSFPLRHARLYKLLRKADSMFRHTFPFNRWADHIIVTFRFRSD
jgi:ubiquinone/menaquinone biosynthesis C-methylase UbiE